MLFLYLFLADGHSALVKAPSVSIVMYPLILVGNRKQVLKYMSAHTPVYHINKCWAPQRGSKYLFLTEPHVTWGWTGYTVTLKGRLKITRRVSTPFTFFTQINFVYFFFPKWILGLFYQVLATSFKIWLELCLNV